MILNSATSAPTVTDATGTKANAGTDPAAAQDRFLKLLVAQLNNQDPMNPLDNAQMTSQIAQINTVTGIQQLNQTMQSMAEQFNSLQVMQGTALIGRNVMTEGSSLAVADKAGKGGFERGFLLIVVPVLPVVIVLVLSRSPVEKQGRRTVHRGSDLRERTRARGACT